MRCCRGKKVGSDILLYSSSEVEAVLGTGAFDSQSGIARSLAQASCRCRDNASELSSTPEQSRTWQAC